MGSKGWALTAKERVLESLVGEGNLDMGQLGKS